MQLQRRAKESQHQQQRQRRRRRLPPGGASYMPALLIALLVLMQHIDGRQLMAKEAVKDAGEELVQSRDKRAAHSQPEEIFNASPGLADANDMSYDEYPMIVPKRAALLLDRLMIALHHALEHEKSAHRVNELFASKYLPSSKPTEYINAAVEPQSTEDDTNASNFHMYSDDDPNVMMDYDFKDLNQINRATGETLMAKSFQRRANMGGGNGGVGGGVGATEAVSLLTNSATLEGATGARGRGSGGRMYWRCYFNAVSCF